MCIVDHFLMWTMIGTITHLTAAQESIHILFSSNYISCNYSYLVYNNIVMRYINILIVINHVHLIYQWLLWGVATAEQLKEVAGFFQGAIVEH